MSESERILDECPYTACGGKQLQAENKRLQEEVARLTAVTGLCCNNQLAKKKLEQALKGKEDKNGKEEEKDGPPEVN